MKTTLNCEWFQIAPFVVILLTCHNVAAATFSLNPGADAFVTTGASGSLSGNNYGGAGALSVAAANSSQGEFQSVLQFGLSPAKAFFDTQFGAGQWSIQSVTLQLTATPPNNGIFNASSAGQFSLSWMQNDSWTEGSGTPASLSTTGITFSTLSNFVGIADEGLGTFSYNGGTSGNSPNTLGLTPLFSAEVLAGNTVSLRMFAADTVISYLSDSRSFGTASARPLLTITAVPEPTLFGLSVLGLSIVAYRRCSVRLSKR